MSKKREDSEPEAPVNPGRRRLLGMALYVPPIVIGAISLTQAGCQPAPCSCQPNPMSCPPPSPANPQSPQENHDNTAADPTPET